MVKPGYPKLTDMDMTGFQRKLHLIAVKRKRIRFRPEYDTICFNRQAFQGKIASIL